MAFKEWITGQKFPDHADCDILKINSSGVVQLSTERKTRKQMMDTAEDVRDYASDYAKRLKKKIS